MSKPQLKTVLEAALIAYLDAAALATKGANRLPLGLTRTEIYRACFRYVRSKLRPAEIGAYSAGIQGFQSESTAEAADSTPINIRLYDEEESYVSQALSLTAELTRSKLGNASVRFTKSKLTEAELAAFALGEVAPPPPPPPPPLPPQSRRNVVVFGIAVLIVCGEAMSLPRGIAALRTFEKNESHQSSALLATASAVMTFQQSSGLRWTPGKKAQQDMLAKLIPAARDKILWVTTDAEDPRILPRILAAQVANPGLKISIITNPESTATAGILRMAHRLDCTAATSAIGHISWLLVDDQSFTDATTSFATGTTRNASLIDSLNQWAVLLTAPPLPKN